MSAAQPALASDYSELYQRVSAPRSWASVHDTARFVLERVAPRASASEREAGVALLALLEGFAWPKGA